MILITGDLGFIGTYVSSFLVRNGYSLQGIDLVPRNTDNTDYPHVLGNILDKNAVMQAMRGTDCIIHLAAEHKDFGVSNEKYFEVNRDGTKQLLVCASELGVKKFLFLSSVAVYGDQQAPSEDALPHPVNAYGQSKLAAEHAVREWSQEDPTRACVIIRPTVVFGPFNRANIFRLIKYVCDGKFVWVGSGEHIKSVAYVENLVEATHLVLQRMHPGVEIFNYSDDPQMTTRELVALIAQKADVAMPKVVIPLEVGLLIAKFLDALSSLTHRDFSITSARIKKFNTSTYYPVGKIRSLGFEPPYSIEYGIEQTTKWYFEELRKGRVLKFESSKD